MHRSPSDLSKGSLPKFPKAELTNPEQYIASDLPMDIYKHLLISATDDTPQIPSQFVTYETTASIEQIPGYPSEPNQFCMNPETTSLFDVSTLFYIFFYFPSTNQQLYVARELKSRGWMFHSIYQTWFCRIGDAKEITNEYEVGDYMYFDHSESNWCVRRRNNFKFEYDPLEYVG